MNTLVLTPTKNKVLPFKTAGFESLIDGLEYAAQGESGFNFYNSQAELVSVLSYADWLNSSIKMAHYLLAYGLKKGDHLPIIAENKPEFLVLFYACQYIGVIVCPLPAVTSRVEYAFYAEKTLRLASLTNAKFIVSSDAFINAFFSENTGSFRFISFESLLNDSQKESVNADSSHFSPIKGDDISFIQFSSGSTSEPKGITIHNKDVCQHIRVILEDLMQLRSDDRSFSWLPFYHNMGLIGYALASVNGQRSVDFLSPLAFSTNPATWIKLLSQNKTALTSAPMFAYQLAISVFDQEAFEGLDLSTLRCAGIGSDAIRLDVMKRFYEIYGAYGFNYQAFQPCYGMSEAILAISGKVAQRQVVTDLFEGKELVSCGTVLPDCQVKIVNDDNEVLLEGSVGNIHFKNQAMTGILSQPSLKLSGEDGYVNTGDIGYLRSQNLFILGRKKDVILIRGRNIWAQDVRTAIIAGEFPFGLEDIIVLGLEIDQEERLVVMIQSAESDEANLTHQKALKAQISQQFNVLADIVFVTVGALPVSPSGKVSRDRFAEIYHSQLKQH